MRKIVVAEASPTIKSVADTLLRQNGFDVICTSDGLQAWEVIQSERPDLVFAGLNLSGISGLELCKQVSGGQPDSRIPVILMLGAKDALSDEQLRSSGARGRLKKPFSPRDLLDAVKRVIGQDETALDQMGNAHKGTAKTTYKSEVVPGSTNVPAGDSGVYNLDWTDLENMGDAAQGSEAVAGADSDSQQLVVDEDQYNLIQGLGEDEPGEDQAQASDDDEDYEWFVGEMKREIGGGGQAQDKAAPSGERKKPPETPAKQAPSEELKFEDLYPASAAPHPPRKTDLAVAGEVKKSRPANGLTQDEIEKIAEKVVSRLAARIASQIDRKIVYEAIRSVLKS